MRSLSVLFGWLGVLIFLIGIAGRFYQQPSITIAGYTFRAISFLILANTFLLLAIFLHLRSTKRNA
jgi:hypothetical protein